jgi:hypothetical protein
MQIMYTTNVDVRMIKMLRSFNCPVAHPTLRVSDLTAVWLSHDERHSLHVWTRIICIAGTEDIRGHIGCRRNQRKS